MYVCIIKSYTSKSVYYVRVVVYDVNNDNEPFYNCPKELVLYANEGSTTEKYAQENGIKFEKLYNNN